MPMPQVTSSSSQRKVCTRWALLFKYSTRASLEGTSALAALPLPPLGGGGRKKPKVLQPAIRTTTTTVLTDAMVRTCNSFSARENGTKFLLLPAKHSEHLFLHRRHLLLVEPRVDHLVTRAGAGTPQREN